MQNAQRELDRRSQPSNRSGADRGSGAEKLTGLEYLKYLREKQSQKKQVNAAESFVMVDRKMQKLYQTIEQVAPSTAPVLVTGESGSGKEVVSSMIHSLSDRNAKPFIGVNCAAIPAELMESELFGHEKGSFTGASSRHAGKFEQAGDGTLLLDEITEISPALQAKLLRVLQEKEFVRVGGSEIIRSDARIIATTNQDLTKLVKEGKFRQDLYYRLYVIHLEVPALRERPKDIEALSAHFLKAYSKNLTSAPSSIATDAMQKLLSHKWPGNVRELQNVIQRAIIACETDTVTSKDIPLNKQVTIDNDGWVKNLPVGKTLREIETEFIILTLGHHNGNRTHAARTLGISLRTLRNKINEFTAQGYDVPAPTSGRAL